MDEFPRVPWINSKPYTEMDLELNVRAKARYEADVRSWRSRNVDSVRCQPFISELSQGLCETTLTERFENPECRCDTYEGNLGPCLVFEEGANGRCVYCDHERECHG